MVVCHHLYLHTVGYLAELFARCVVDEELAALVVHLAQHLAVEVYGDVGATALACHNAYRHPVDVVGGVKGYCLRACN